MPKEVSFRPAEYSSEEESDEYSHAERFGPPSSPLRSVPARGGARDETDAAPGNKHDPRAALLWTSTPRAWASYEQIYNANTP